MTIRTKTGGCGCGAKTVCEPACTGLECLERPRFFAGQLLTDQELNGLSAHVQAKNKLHNLHLHGWGVVCGLEASCHPDCAGSVRVAPGYAIDSCGNDVIVCGTAEINILERIRECREKRRQRVDCRRGEPREPKPPQDREERWCITLHYEEKQVRATAALRQQSCGCCESSGCTCGNKNGRSSGAPGGRTRELECEPSRVLESYRIDLCEAPDDGCSEFGASSERAWVDKFTACIENLTSTFKGAPKIATAHVANAVLVNERFSARFGPEAATADQLHVSFCTIRDYLLDLLRRSPGFLHCSLLDKLRSIECAPPGPNDTLDSYRTAQAVQLRAFASVVFLYLLDCFCNAALPPCAPCCEEDDALVIACLTVRGDNIVDICNYSCRRWAGMFPPSIGGVYLGPLMPLVAKVLEVFCCGDLFDRLIGTFRKNPRVKGFTDFMIRDQAAAPRVAFEAASAWPQQFDAPEEATLHLPSIAGLKPEAAIAEAAKKKVELIPVAVPRVSSAERLGAAGRAYAGERIIGLVDNSGTVLGFARASGLSDSGGKDRKRLEDLEKQVAILSERLGGLG